ncbi:MAG: chorismate mutase [Vulcanisaeta sp. AZ3]|jgi:chorismate mutase/prephenate dehydrogenase
MLNALRSEIDSIDEELIDLLIKRLELARRLGVIKREAHLPIIDVEREEEVISRWVSRLVGAGVNEELAHELVNAIIRASTYVQVGDRLNVSVTIVGSGRVGRTMARVLSRVATVSLIHLGDELGRSDVIMLATRPTNDAVDFVVKNVEALRNSILVDLFSVKSVFFRVFEDLSLSHGFHYVSAHPLFGEVGEPVGEGVVLIPSRSGGEGINLIRDLFGNAGLSVIILDSPEEHDRLMAYLQVAHHLALLALYVLFKRVGVELRGPLLTHSLRYTVRAMDRVLSQLDVVEEIQRLNPYSRAVKEEFLNALRLIINAVNKDELTKVIK